MLVIYLNMLSVITHHIEKLIIRVVSSKIGCDWFSGIVVSVIEIIKGIVYNENLNFQCSLISNGF